MSLLLARQEVQGAEGSKFAMTDVRKNESGFHPFTNLEESSAICMKDAAHDSHPCAAFEGEPHRGGIYDSI